MAANNIKPEDLHAANTKIFKDPSSKRQASSEPRNLEHGSSPKQQASSDKPQATSSVILEPRYK
jgi:hypothetical protein